MGSPNQRMEIIMKRLFVFLLFGLFFASAAYAQNPVWRFDELGRTIGGDRAPLATFYKVASSTADTAEHIIQTTTTNSGLFWNITFASCYNTGSTDTRLLFKDTASGSVVWWLACPKGPSGSVEYYGDIPIRSTADGKALIVAGEDSTTTLYFKFKGYMSPQ